MAMGTLFISHVLSVPEKSTSKKKMAVVGKA